MAAGEWDYNKAERERKEAEIQEEIDVSKEHGWGDWKTWAWILALVFGLLISSAFIYFIVGRPWLGEWQWNLGQPPTGPNMIFF